MVLSSIHCAGTICFPPHSPRRKYSWEREEELAAAAAAGERGEFDLPSPREVPVLWERPAPERGTILPFRREGRRLP